MKKRYNSRFDMEITELGFGGWSLGSINTWGNLSEEEGVKLVKDAIAKGINFFDTAPNYSEGRSEEIIGKGIKGNREKLFINTKFGHHPKFGMNFEISDIEASLDESLKRLNTDYVDSLILHNPPMDILNGKTDHFKELNRLKKLGKIKGYGVSIDTLSELETTLKHLDIDVIELLFHINHQDVKRMFPKIKERDILLITKVPLDSGWLTGKYSEDSVFTGVRNRWTQEDKEVRSYLVNKIKNIVGQNDLVPIALSFILSFDAVTTVIPGMKDASQLESNLQAVNYRLSEDIKKQLEDLYDSEIRFLHVPW